MAVGLDEREHGQSRAGEVERVLLEHGAKGLLQDLVEVLGQKGLVVGGDLDTAVGEEEVAQAALALFVAEELFGIVAEVAHVE